MKVREIIRKMIEEVDREEASEFTLGYKRALLDFLANMKRKR